MNNPFRWIRNWWWGEHHREHFEEWLELRDARIRHEAEEDLTVVHMVGYEKGKLEGACKLVMALGYATGHADTYEELLRHVLEQKGGEHDE